MFDVALGDAGAQVVLVTASDERFPPENIIDGKSDTFWSTTGMFPQEFVISFTSLMNINSIKIESYNVNKMFVERSVQNEPVDFEPLDEREVDATDSQLQIEEVRLQSTTAQHLKFVINSGHNHFVSVHRVHVDGTAVHK
ncbi:intraflagellar transport protein 25 homolog [Lineus longissimus]|uniref:intraflagellar transport protein 25 homolog n=1 Tax=Lineus longissimus TaxID=88925 RepID=UPI002B4E9976